MICSLTETIVPYLCNSFDPNGLESIKHPNIIICTSTVTSFDINTLNFVPPGASEVICGDFDIGVGEVDFSGDELTVAEADNFAFPLYFEPPGACERIFFVFAILLQPISNQTQKFLLLSYLMQIKDHREK